MIYRIFGHLISIIKYSGFQISFEKGDEIVWILNGKDWETFTGLQPFIWQQTKYNIPKFSTRKNSFVDLITFTLLEGEKMKYELFFTKIRNEIAGYCFYQTLSMHIKSSTVVI